MIVAVASLWLAATNCYVVAAERGGPAVVVDAPPDPEAISGLLSANDLFPEALLVTHGHVDHTGGAGRLVATTKVSAFLHPDDGWLASDPLSQLRALFGGVADPGAFSPPSRFVDLVDGAVLSFGGLEWTILHTPGHTPGHCCFLLAEERVLFSGDHLFAGSIGRTDLPGGDHARLMASMRDKVLVLDDATDVLPGHGPATTLARERALNPFLKGL